MKIIIIKKIVDIMKIVNNNNKINNSIKYPLITNIYRTNSDYYIKEYALKNNLNIFLLPL